MDELKELLNRWKDLEVGVCTRRTSTSFLLQSQTSGTWFVDLSVVDSYPVSRTQALMRVFLLTVDAILDHGLLYSLENEANGQHYAYLNDPAIKDGEGFGGQHDSPVIALLQAYVGWLGRNTEATS